MTDTPPVTPADDEPVAAPADDTDVDSTDGTSATTDTDESTTGPTGIVNTVTPPANPDVTPTASETPNPADTEPGDHPGILLPTDGNWSTEQIAAADRLGIDTPAGAALSAASREILRGIENSLVGMESWIAHMRKTLASIPES